ncbi:thioredoxin family protein [Natronosalvus halobius]|uniref:thioredoxin family protein n=1 Tax=Natronosalvus halobius TaxID=2953746 RepID=UPI00209F1C9A|nr:thioredoxin family protein [Natronosalvus halobius]USZ71810.1 thioredoxin family protein [Natronosalvus halobius]
MTDPTTADVGETAETSDQAAERSARPVALKNEADLEAFVADHDRALVEFYTAGCSMCDAMVPVLGGVARATDVAIATINPRDDPPLIERFDVRSVPLLVLFADGDPVARRADGFVPAEEVIGWLESETEQ